MRRGIPSLRHQVIADDSCHNHRSDVKRLVSCLMVTLPLGLPRRASPITGVSYTLHHTSREACCRPRSNLRYTHLTKSTKQSSHPMNSSSSLSIHFTHHPYRKVLLITALDRRGCTAVIRQYWQIVRVRQARQCSSTRRQAPARSNSTQSEKGGWSNDEPITILYTERWGSRFTKDKQSRLVILSMSCW